MPQRSPAEIRASIEENRQALVKSVDATRNEIVRLTDWRGRPWTPESPEPAAHPNARFTVHAGQCPVIATCLASWP